MPGRKRTNILKNQKCYLGSNCSSSFTWRFLYILDCSGPRCAIVAPPTPSVLQNRGKIVIFQVSPMTATLRLPDKTDVDFADPCPASDFAKRVKNFDDVLSNPPLSIKLSMNCDLACWVEASYDLSYILLI